MFGGEKINVRKEKAGTVFEVTIDRDNQRLTGTMEIVDPRDLKLKFDLKALENGQEFSFEMTEVDGKLKVNGAISGLAPVGILRSFEVQKKEEER
ncbi:MAG: hypothetical protein PHW01_00990 [Patescibacteria group bacterium]|nr:hypothetical protein [Patescibacteria group bacterium]